MKEGTCAKIEKSVNKKTYRKLRKQYRGGGKGKGKTKHIRKDRQK